MALIRHSFSLLEISQYLHFDPINMFLWFEFCPQIQGKVNHQIKWMPNHFNVKNMHYHCSKHVWFYSTVFCLNVCML